MEDLFLEQTKDLVNENSCKKVEVFFWQRCLKAADAKKIRSSKKELNFPNFNFFSLSNPNPNHEVLIVIKGPKGLVKHQVQVQAQHVLEGLVCLAHLAHLVRVVNSTNRVNDQVILILIFIPVAPVSLGLAGVSTKLLLIHTPITTQKKSCPQY